MTKKTEFEFLNIEDLDVQELENRLEMSGDLASSGAWFRDDGLPTASVCDHPTNPPPGCPR
ncbi:MAG: hypothetical protein M3388_11185 [Acidobacteriota bacterium]|nr:hypothetical protein [Acidobacteriota bacterium]